MWLVMSGSPGNGLPKNKYLPDYTKSMSLDPVINFENNVGVLAVESLYTYTITKTNKSYSGHCSKRGGRLPLASALMESSPYCVGGWQGLLSLARFDSFSQSVCLCTQL